LTDQTTEPSHESGAQQLPGAPPVEREFTVETRSQWNLVLRRFLAHRAAVISLVLLVLIALVAFFGAPLWHYTFSDLTGDYSKPPSGKHPFGTDSQGHDAFAQVLRGSQRSLEIAIFVAVTATFLGTVAGAVAGFYGGWRDSLIMRFVDLILTLPVIAIAAILGHQVGGKASGWLYIALVFSALFWAPMARVIRGVTLSLREKEFVEAARALGASDRRIIFRHILPNTTGQIIVNLTIYVAVAILAETGLSFVGFGVRAPDVSLGNLVSDAATAASTRPWLFYFPGLFIIMIALTINFIGDGLRDALDPTQTRVRS
jgi:peptide/nickel transport system permease protein